MSNLFNEMMEELCEKDKKISDLEAKLAESETQLKEELAEKNGVKRALSACNRQNDEFADMIKKLVNEEEELKQQLVESEKSKESYRLQNEDHHLKLLQFYSRLGVEAFGADIHEKALETLMIMKEQLEESKEENEKLVKALNGDIFINYKVPMENTKLKQQLHDLPKKIVEEIRDVAGDYREECGNVTDLYTLTMEDFDEILDTILEKFGAEDESNND